jgi:hypothetical protein
LQDEVTRGVGIPTLIQSRVSEILLQFRAGFPNSYSN